MLPSSSHKRPAAEGSPSLANAAIFPPLWVVLKRSARRHPKTRAERRAGCMQNTTPALCPCSFHPVSERRWHQQGKQRDISMTPALLKASHKHTCGRASSGAWQDAAQHRYKHPQNNFCEHRDIFSKASREGAKVQPPPFPNKKQASPCACENLAVQSTHRQLGFPILFLRRGADLRRRRRRLQQRCTQRARACSRQQPPDSEPNPISVLCHFIRLIPTITNPWYCIFWYLNASSLPQHGSVAHFRGSTRCKPGWWQGVPAQGC